mgnify:CR=1 FL=1
MFFLKNLHLQIEFRNGCDCPLNICVPTWTFKQIAPFPIGTLLPIVGTFKILLSDNLYKILIRVWVIVYRP